MTHESFGPGRVIPPTKVAPEVVPPAQSRRTARLGPVAVLIVVLLAVVAGLVPLVVPGTLLEQMPAASPPR